MIGHVVITLAAVMSAAGPPSPPRESAINDSLALVAVAGTRSLTLSEFFILSDSDSLLVNGLRLRRDQDYAIDYSASAVTLAEPLGPGDTVRAYFLRLPLRITEPVRFMPPASPPSRIDSAGGSWRAQMAEPAREWEGEGQGIRLGGNKSLAVTVGSGRDLSVEQALQVSINGRVWQDLELNAYLSDQEMPLSATGSTQELDQLDRIYIKAKAPDWEVTMGDYDLSMRTFRLAAAERQAKGASAQGRWGRFRASASTAVAKGKRATVSFLGQDGLQGPYLLAVASGSAVAPILANSERVWLDGQLLKRGETEDYTIDYQQARMTFTPRRPVDSDSRIMAEFQYSHEEFHRGLNGAEAEIRVAPGLTLGVGYLSDRDEPDRPLQGELDEGQLEVLAGAGDDTTLLWVDGGTPSDSGEYDLVDSVYVYVGPGGHYRVSFTWAGTGAGDYSYRPLLGYYEYAGAGNGDYLARARLPRPEGQRVVAVSPRYRWEGGRFEAEGAWSESDLNLLSGLDDGDNAGLAWGYDLCWSRDTLPWGGFNLFSRAWRVHRDFWTGGAGERPDLRAEWGLAGWRDLREHDPWRGRRSHQHDVSYWPGRFLRLGAGYGGLRLGDSLEAERLHAWATLSPAQWVSGTYRRQSAELEGPWFLVPGIGGRRASHDIALTLMSGAYRVEGGSLSSDDITFLGDGRESGRRSQEIWAGLRRSLGRGSAGTSYRRQEDLSRDSSQTDWEGQWHADTWKNDFKLQPWPSLDASLEHTSRIKTMRPGGEGLGSESHLALVQLALRPWRQALNVASDYSLNLTQTQQKREEYYQVPAGAGQYSYDPATGSFYPDTSGNFLRKVLDDGPAAGTVEASLRGSASFDPSLSFPHAWWSRFRAELSGQARINSFRPVTAKLLGFAPSRLWDRWGNASSGLDLSADAWYRREPWSHHLRMRWRRDDDNQFLNRHATHSRLERAWDATAQAAPDLRVTLRAQMENNETRTEERGLESRLSPVRLGTELARQARRDLELTARLEWLGERVERSYRSPGDFAAVFREYTGEAGAAKHWGLNGSLRLSAGSTRRLSDRSEEDLPAEYSYTRPLGWTGFWRAQYDYRLNRNLTATAVYEARDEPGRKSRHNGRMELRAYF